MLGVKNLAKWLQPQVNNQEVWFKETLLWKTPQLNTFRVAGIRSDNAPESHFMLWHSGNFSGHDKMLHV